MATAASHRTPETIASGEYPMSRPLFIYVNTDEAAARPELAAFVDYYLSDEGIAAVTEADYVAVAPDVLEADAIGLGEPLTVHRSTRGRPSGALGLPHPVSRRSVIGRRRSESWHQGRHQG